MKHWIPGTDPLAPMPLTAAERDDLVARARLAQTEVLRHRCRIAGLAAARARRHSATIRVAVRYVRLAGVPVPEARRTIGELTGQWPSLTAIRSLWDKLYPGEKRPQGRPGGGSKVWQRRQRAESK